MQRSLRLFILTAALAGLQPDLFGQAGQSDTAKYLIREVTITAPRIGQRFNRLNRIAGLIDKDAILASPARTLPELLESIPDIDVRQRGSFGVQADISMRGGSFDQSAVLLNGMNLSDPQTGHFHLDVPLPLTLVSRIEVLPGSDARSLGANAYAGAINLVTQPPEYDESTALIAGGSYGYAEAGAAVRLRSGRIWQQFAAGLERSSGYLSNTDFDTRNLVYQMGYHSGRISADLLAGGLLKAFGANSFYSPKYPDQFERTSTALVAARVQAEGNPSVRQSILFRHHDDEFTLFRINPPAWYVSPNFHRTRVWGSKTDLLFGSRFGTTGIGLEMRHESIISSVLGLPMETPVPVPGTEGRFYSYSGTRNHLTLTAEQQSETGILSLTGGLAIHYARSSTNYLNLYPGLNAGIRLGSGVRIILSANRAFRLPTYTELYYKSPVNRGNPNLNPESAWHGEAGFSYSRAALSARISGFYRYAGESIDWVRTPSETVWHTENLGRVVTSGLEAGFAWKRGIPGGASIRFDEASLGFRYYLQHHSVEGLTSLYLTDYLKWKMTAGLVFIPLKPVRIDIRAIWQERNGTYTAFGADQNPYEVDYKPFMLVDARISYTLHAYSLFIEVSNLLDSEYFDFAGVIQPGLWVRGGIRISLSERN